MARIKRTSDALTKAEKREAGLRTIEGTLEFSQEVTLQGYSQLIQTLRTQISDYNSALTTADHLAREVKDTEKALRTYSEKMLLNVAAFYGKDSREYGKAGGVPTSERKKGKGSRKAKVASVTSISAESEQAIASSLPVVDLNGNGKATLNGTSNGNGQAIVS
jgi:hypothetical protein